MWINNILHKKWAKKKILKSKQNTIRKRYKKLDENFKLITKAKLSFLIGS